MLQERLRSVVYRSFVTCDDPKGVVDCGTIRKYKKGPQKMKHKVEAQQAPNESSRSLQILEASRGGEKLNKTIGSWCKGVSCSGRPEVAAKDLLKGALDLQESLAMLEKLQEASKYMTQLKKQKEKNNVDGPSRDCIEQLREAIRDGFMRQNLLLSRSNARTEEKACLCGRSSEMPSTSSSQFSTDHPDCNRFGSPSARQWKPKGPNLIAKLMGLEEVPSKPVQADSKQITSQRKPIHDNDSMKEHKPQSTYDFPPIVLIKPMRARLQEPEAQEPAFHEEGSSRLNLKKTQRKEVVRKLISKEVCNVPKEAVREEKNEAVVKRVDKIQKMASAGPKPVAKETVKSQSVSRSQDQARVVTKTKGGKSENGSNIRKLQNSEKQKAMTHLISESTKQPISRRKKNQEKGKPREKHASQGITKNLVCQEDKKINTTSENESLEKETYSTPTEAESDALELHIEEDCRFNPIHETAKEDSKSSKTQTELEAFLLSNPSFMSRVDELFDLNASFPLASQASNTDNSGISNEELSLAYANEFIERRSLPDSRTIHPLLLACTGNTRVRISPNHLMEEVCDAVETLESYSKLGHENSPVVDHLFAVSERDMLSDGVVTGTWDLGWRKGFSVDEAERVVNDLEKLLFWGLIEEAFS